MVFHTKAQITNNKNNSSKFYDNVLIIRDTNFDNFLNKIEGEEIEEIQFKLKKKTENGVKRYHSYTIKINKKTKELKGELIQYKPNFMITSFESAFSNIPKTSKTKIQLLVKIT
jgi:hypothetical protein